MSQRYYLTVRVQDIDTGRWVIPSRSFEFARCPLLKVTQSLHQRMVTVKNLRAFIRWLQMRGGKEVPKVLGSNFYAGRWHVATWSECRWMGVQTLYYTRPG